MPHTIQCVTKTPVDVVQCPVHCKDTPGQRRDGLVVTQLAWDGSQQQLFMIFSWFKDFFEGNAHAQLEFSKLAIRLGQLQELSEQFGLHTAYHRKGHYWVVKPKEREGKVAGEDKTSQEGCLSAAHSAESLITSDLRREQYGMDVVSPEKEDKIKTCVDSAFDGDGKREADIEDKVKVSSLAEGHLGHFFVNRVRLNGDKSRIWLPPHLKNSATEYLDFSDIVLLEGLLLALIVDDQKLTDFGKYTDYFPRDVGLMIICPSASGRGDKAFFQTVKDCPTHRQDYDEHDQQGGLSDVKCHCEEIREVAMVHPSQSSKLSAKFMLLRYAWHMRIIIPSGCFDPEMDEDMLTFGWYVDLPIREEAMRASGDEMRLEMEKHPFSADLCCMLSNLNGNPYPILNGVDFSGLSPCVQLLCSVPGQYTDATARRLGMLKLGAAIKANMQADDSVIDNEVLYYTNSIGFLEVDSLSDLCKYTNTKKENFKIAYPSNAYVDGIPSAVNEKPYYHFADRFGLSRCYLHDTVPSPFSRSKFIVCRGQQDGRPASSPITLLYLGSHRLAAKSLGTVSHGGSVIKLESYDMGLLVCSWTTEEGVCHVPDMSTLGIPVDVNKLHKYAADDIPYIPSAYNHLKVHRAVGKLVRAVPKKSFGFLSKLLPTDPLYDCIEPEKLKFPERELFIHLDTIKDSGFSNQLVAGSIFDVFYAKLKTHTNKRESNPRAFYVVNIIREGDAKKEKPSPLFEENTGRMLAEMFGSDDCTPPDGSSAKKISIQRHLTLDPEKSFEENMVVLGLNSDEEIDEYMRTNWFSGALAVKRGKRQQMMCSIEPDPCLSLNRFMERYITWRYGKNWHPYAFGPCSYHNVLRSFRCVV